MAGFKLLFSAQPVIGPSVPLGQPTVALASPFLPSTAAPTTPGPSSSEMAALVCSTHHSMTLRQQQFSELATLIRALLAVPVTTTASEIPAPAADPPVPWSSISATVSLSVPGIVDAGVLSTAPPQVLGHAPSLPDFLDGNIYNVHLGMLWCAVRTLCHSRWRVG